MNTTINKNIHKARAKNIKITETSDGVKFVEAELLIFKNNDAELYGVTSYDYIHWRSPLTLGGIKKTFLSLLKMGAKMELNEKDEVDNPLDGVGSKIFDVEIIQIECDENEAPGKFKTFARVII